MTQEQKAEYKKLARQIDEAKRPNLFNNRLAKMQTFLSTLEGDYSSNRFNKIKPYKLLSK